MHTWLFHRLSNSVAVSLSALAFLGAFQETPNQAHACGGLFCSASAPVNQTAERILFAQNDETTTQIVEILYEGPAERFSWILPVPGIPEVEVSSGRVFDRLQAATNPTYTLNTSATDCGNNGILRATADSAGSLPGAGEADPMVSVLEGGTVGPFDYEVLSVDPGDSDPADVALSWLEDNDYDVGSLGADVLRPYLENGLNLIAVRLTKGESTGSIRPLSLTFTGTRPSIPIRPTAVAAAEDMGILVWLLGRSRAVPVNYKGLVLNELYIDWFNPGDTYDQVVSLAADEAGGHGFVTEFSGEASPFHDTIVTEADKLTAQAYPGSNLRDELGSLVARYGNYDGFAKALGENVTFRSPITTDDFIACSDCYFSGETFDGRDYGEYDPETDPIVETNMEQLVSTVQEQVLTPIEEAADLFLNYDHVTRLYTTMSADEMDDDPLFDFNSDLEDVSNIHVAERLLGCENGDWRVTLPDGRKVYGNGNTWPITPETTEELPFNARVLSFSTVGEPDVDTDNASIISQEFSSRPASQPNSVEADVFGCSHSTGRSAPSGWPWLLGLTAAYLIARQRRRSTIV